MTNGRFVQARDKQTGELVWQIPVMDADPSLKAAQKTVAVKILAPVQPVPPAPVAGLPFTPVEFDGLTITPYVNGSGRSRRTSTVTSWRVTSVRRRRQFPALFWGVSARWLPKTPKKPDDLRNGKGPSQDFPGDGPFCVVRPEVLETPTF
ncbi:hypothetical protein [Nonomuraea maritima]|uniref:hypothetical protein n=1 Tax=Nonomuraea maritima TaxID=683260 RepID=UPI00371A5F2D